MYSEEQAGFVTDFIQCLKHVDGKWYGVPFELLPWQREAITEFYGTLKENGARQYQYLYLEIPKKNGKSELAAGLGLYHTFGDGEMHGEVYVVAADKDVKQHIEANSDVKLNLIFLVVFHHIIPVFFLISSHCF